MKNIVFRFSVDTDWNLSARKNKYTGIKNARHTDQLNYVFRLSRNLHIFPDEAYRSLKENSLERRIIKLMTNFFADFVKFR